MPVTVSRPIFYPPPPDKIEASLAEPNFGGNRVVFTNAPRAGIPALSVRTSYHYSDERSGCLAHIGATEARELAAALLEWADAVEA